MKHLTKLLALISFTLNNLTSLPAIASEKLLIERCRMDVCWEMYLMNTTKIGKNIYTVTTKTVSTYNGINVNEKTVGCVPNYYTVTFTNPDGEKSILAYFSRQDLYGVSGAEAETAKIIKAVCFNEYNLSDPYN